MARFASNSRALTRDLEPKVSSPAGILSLYLFLRDEFSDASPEDLDLTRREFFAEKARAKVRPLLLDIAIVLPSPREIPRPTEIQRWEGATGDAWSRKASGATNWRIRAS